MNERLEIMGDWYEAMNLEQERNEALAAAPQPEMTDEEMNAWYEKEFLDDNPDCDPERHAPMD